MKLMLFLSHNGILSRRKAFDAVKNGEVSVNGSVEREPSADVDPSRDQVRYHERPIINRIFEYVILNKPEGYVTTCGKQFGQQTVMDLLPKELKHLRPVGRLDLDTEGLLLFTNDGGLANQLAHPAFDVDKTYFARVQGLIAPETVQRLEAGIVLDERKTAPARVDVLLARADVSEIQITIHEGRKHQVRLMLDAVGHKVLYLKRLAQGPLVLGHLRPGDWRRLTEEEVSRLTMIKRAAAPAVKLGSKRGFRPQGRDKAYVGRRGRGEANRERQASRPRPSFTPKTRPQNASAVEGRPSVSRREKERPRTPRPAYSSSSGHRSAPSDSRRSYKGGQRAEGRGEPSAPRPLFSSHSAKRKFSTTREWHSDSDAHAPGRPDERRPGHNNTSGPRRP